MKREACVIITSALLRLPKKKKPKERKSQKPTKKNGKKEKRRRDERSHLSRYDSNSLSSSKLRYAQKLLKQIHRLLTMPMMDHRHGRTPPSDATTSASYTSPQHFLKNAYSHSFNVSNVYRISNNKKNSIW